jgi:amino acid transporter
LKKLERSLGLLPVIAISISAMLGSGIFVLPGLAATLTGPSIWLAYLASAICILPAALSKSELATAMPTSGGTYVYLERTFGPLAGTISGLGLWLSLLLKCAFALVGFGAYLTVVADFPLQSTALCLLILITFLNILGVGKIGSILVFIVSFTILCLTTLSGWALTTFEPSNYQNLFPNGFSGFINATALVFVSFAGVTKVAAIAEEIKRPEKNLPKGIIYSLIIVTILYCLVTFVLMGNFSVAEISGNYKPIYSLALKLGGATLGTLAAILGIVTMTSMANAGILASSRFPFAMSRDHLIPSIIGKLHKRFLTPTVSIILSGCVVGAAIVFLDVAKIAKLASAFMILIYIFENIAVLVLRETRVAWYKPTYKVPLYPLTQILGIVSGVLLLVGMGSLVLSAIAAVSIPGLLIYAFYSHKKTDRKGVVGIRGKRSDLLSHNEIEPQEPLKVETLDFSKDAKVVVALFGRERSSEVLVEMGSALAEKNEKIEVAHFTEAPEQSDLSDFGEESALLKSLRRRLHAMAKAQETELEFDPVVSHDLSRSIFEVSQRLHCEWLLMEWGGKTRGNFTFHNPLGWLKSHLQSNLAIFRDTGVRYIRKVMIVVQDQPNDNLVLATADHLASVYNASLTIVKYSPTNNPEDEFTKCEQTLSHFSESLDNKSNFRVVTGRSFSDSIVSTTEEYDLLVFGAGKHTFVSDLFGSKDDQLMAGAVCSVLCVQTANL